jgi:hypothetical protein
MDAKRLRMRECLIGKICWPRNAEAMVTAADRAGVARANAARGG